MKYLPLCRVPLSTGGWENGMPCPFCATVELESIELFEPDENLDSVSVGFVVACVTCGAHGPRMSSEVAAVTDWNTRYFYQDDNDAPWRYAAE